MTEKLVFLQTFEGLVRAYGSRFNHELRTNFRLYGFDPERLLPAYPQQTFVEVLRLISRELHPHEEPNTAIRLTAKGFLDGYDETLVGRAMLAAIRIIGPRRTLERLTRQFRTGNNFSDTRLTQLGPTEFELWCNEVQLPGWYEGLLLRGLEIAGASKLEVKFVKRDDSGGGTFHLRWSDK